jgi:hypothetical protein
MPARPSTTSERDRLRILRQNKQQQQQQQNGESLAWYPAAAGAAANGSSSTVATSEQPLQYCHKDERHNDDWPCGRHLMDTVRAVFSTRSSNNSSSPDESLTSLLRHFLLQQRRRQQQQHEDQTAKQKKRRKKKKKKKVADSTSNTSVADEDECEDEGDHGDGGAHNGSSMETTATGATLQQYQELQEEPLVDAYLDDYLNKHGATLNVDTTALMQSFIDFLYTRNTDGNSSTTALVICSDAELRLAVEGIKDEGCRSRVLARFGLDNANSSNGQPPFAVPLRWLPVKSPVTTVVSSRTIPVLGRHHDDDDATRDPCFDYVALEEGTALTLATPNDDHLLTAWAFERVNQDNVQKWQLRHQGDTTIWTVHHMTSLLRTILLPGGLGLDEVRGMVMSDYLDWWNIPHVMQTFSSDVKSQSEEVLAKVRSLATDLVGIMEKLHQLKKTTSANMVEVVNYSMMEDLDEAMDAVLQQLLNLIQTVTLVFLATMEFRSAPSAAAHRTESWRDMGWACRGLLDVWQAYLTTMDDLGAAVAAYEAGLQERADALGCFPPMYLNASLRDFLRRYLEQKVLLVHRGIDQLEQRLFQLEPLVSWGGQQYQASFVRKLYGYRNFHNLHMKYVKKTTQHFDKSNIDLTCYDFIHVVFEDVKTAHVSNCATLLEHRELHRRKVVRMYRKAEDAFTELFEKIKRRDDASAVPAELLRQFDAMAKFPEFSDTTAAFQLHKGERAMDLVRLWMGLRMESDIFVKVQGFPCAITADCLNLISGRDGIKLPSGVSAENRSLAVLSGLLFRWLDERYREWHDVKAESDAVKAERDLLAGMADNSSSEKAGPPKKSKKKKEKKIGATALAETEEVIPTARSAVHPLRAKEEIPLFQDFPPEAAIGLVPRKSALLDIADDLVGEGGWSNVEADKRKGISIRRPAVPVDTSSAPVRNGSKPNAESAEAHPSVSLDSVLPNNPEGDSDSGIRLAPSTTASLKSSDNAIVRLDSNQETEIKIQESFGKEALENVDSLIKVGVFDHKGYQSAKDFLVGRLLAAIESDDAASA